MINKIKKKNRQFNILFLNLVIHSHNSMYYETILIHLSIEYYPSYQLR